MFLINATRKIFCNIFLINVRPKMSAIHYKCYNEFCFLQPDQIKVSNI